MTKPASKWGVCILDGLADRVDYGYTASARHSGNGPKFLRITDIQNDSVDWSSVPVCDCGPDEQTKYRLRPGDIVFARTGATTGKSHLVEDCPENVIFASYLIRVRPNGRVLPRYLAHFFRTLDYWRQVNRRSSGSAQPGVNATKLKSLVVPVPSLPEQERIVAILDEAFAAIATAIANAKKNLANARELFERQLRDVFLHMSKGSAKGRLGEFAEIQSGGTPLRSRTEFWGGEIPWYTSGELNGLLTETPQEHITSHGLHSSNAKLFPKGSLLIGIYDTAALKMSILDRDAAFNQAITGVKPNDRVNLQFVRLAISAMKTEILSLRRGVRQKNLSLRKIRDIEILVPPLSEQDGVVNRLELQRTAVSRLESVYLRKVVSLTELKQSILHKAFTGELTADAKAANRTLSEARL